MYKDVYICIKTHTHTVCMEVCYALPHHIDQAECASLECLHTYTYMHMYMHTHRHKHTHTHTHTHTQKSRHTQTYTRCIHTIALPHHINQAECASLRVLGGLSLTKSLLGTRVLEWLARASRSAAHRLALPIHICICICVCMYMHTCPRMVGTRISFSSAQTCPPCTYVYMYMCMYVYACVC